MKPVGAHRPTCETPPPSHQFDFGGSTAQENVRESEGVDLAEKHGFSVYEKTTAVDDLNSVRSLHFDKIPP